MNSIEWLYSKIVTFLNITEGSDRSRDALQSIEGVQVEVLMFTEELVMLLMRV